MDKKEWVVPQLVVLSRGRPEERVLDGCKYAGEVSGAFDNDCWTSQTSGNQVSCSGLQYS